MNRTLIAAVTSLAIGCGPDLDSDPADPIGAAPTTSDFRITIRRNGSDVFTTTEGAGEALHEVRPSTEVPSCARVYTWHGDASRWQGNGELYIEFAHDAPMAAGVSLALDTDRMVVQKSDFQTGERDFSVKATTGTTTGTIVTWDAERHFRLTNAHWCEPDATGEIQCGPATETVDVVFGAADGAPYSLSTRLQYCVMAEFDIDWWRFGGANACSAPGTGATPCQ